MTKTAAKAKPALIALTLGLLLSTTSVITAAEAATIKNGVACKKSGQKAKTGKKNYVCGNNPYITPTKLTWMLSTCKQANDNYRDVKENYDFLSDLAKTNNYTSLQAMGDALGGDSKKDIDDLVQLVAATENAMKNTLCRRGR